MGTKNTFALHDGCLELGQIASKRFSIDQFAVLSACHAASGLKELPGEAMHLAAGLQFAGFPNVIATMWGISDEDAPKVAEHTYRYLFRNGLGELQPSDASTKSYSIASPRRSKYHSGTVGFVHPLRHMMFNTLMFKRDNVVYRVRQITTEMAHKVHLLSC